MSTHDAKPSQRMKSGRRRGLMGMALALLMLLPTLAISSASAAPTSPAARATGKFNVRATYFWPGANNGRQMSAGQKVDWRGYVSPYISSSRVVIQYKVGSRWYDGAKAKPYGSGYFRVQQQFNSPGVKTIRLRVYSGNRSYNTWTGNPVSITVYGWHYLTRLQAITSGFDQGSVRIDGTLYGESLWQQMAYGGTSGQWNIGRKCTTFKATAGQDDDSYSADGTAEMNVFGDGVLRYSRQVGYGAKYPVSANISGHLRLTLEANDLTDGSYYAGFANAQIRCAF
jgi:hypothetical protein